MRNAFTNKMSTDIKISKSQLTKIIQSGRFLGKTLGILGGKILLDLAVPFTKDVLLKLVTETTSSVLDKFERKIRGKGAIREEKGFTLLISNGDIDDIIKIVESLEKSSPLIDAVTETVKHKIKKQGGGFLGAMVEAMAASLKGPMACSLIQPVASKLINAISGKGEEDRFLLLLALLLMTKVVGKLAMRAGKGIRRAGKVYINMGKIF